jgi:hypothetical protein
MSDTLLRKELIKLAHSNPELRPHLMPLLVKQAGGERTRLMVEFTKRLEDLLKWGLKEAQKIDAEDQLKMLLRATLEQYKVL